MQKINFYSSIFVLVGGIFFLFYEITKNGYQNTAFIIYFITTLTIAEFIAYTTTMNIQNTIFYRSQNYSIKTALPKIPFEVKKSLIFIPINILLLLFVVLGSIYYFTDQLIKSYWPTVLFFVFSVHMLGLMAFFLFKDIKGIEIRKKELEDADRYNVILNIGKKLADKESKSCRKTNTKQYQTILHFLNNGQNPDEVFDGRYTLILPSSCCGDEKLVKLLIERGSDVNFKSSLGNTALHLACENGFYEIATLLVENGADINIKDAHGNTPLYYAQKYNHKDIVEMLKKHI